MRYIKVASVVLLIFTTIQFGLSNCIKGDCQNGEGTYLFDSGARYEGQFKNGLMHGRGILLFSNGDKYLGEFQKHIRTGKGRFIAKDGEIYTGEFRNGKKQGSGKLEKIDGSLLVGLWSNDALVEQELAKPKPQPVQLSNQIVSSRVEIIPAQKLNESSVETQLNSKRILKNCNTLSCHNEEGIFYYKDGSKYIGQFKNGRPYGSGVCYYASGNVYEGQWKDHGPDGEGLMTYTNGRQLGALWQDGELLKELDAKQDQILVRQVSKDKDQAIKTWALIVGVGRYNHMPSLKYTDDDAYRLYAFLKSPEGGAVPEQRIRVLIDEQATRASILRNMQELFFKADENDVVMLYFSGHGLKGSFLPSDYNGFKNKLMHKDIKAIFDKSAARHKIAFADACYAGSLTDAKAASIPAVDRLYTSYRQSGGGMAMLMSSTSEEVSLEDQGLRQGIFSHFLLKGLNGKADIDNNSIITIQEIYAYVSGSVKQYTDNQQNPILMGNYDRNMPIAVVR